MQKSLRIDTVHLFQLMVSKIKWLDKKTSNKVTYSIIDCGALRNTCSISLSTMNLTLVTYAFTLKQYEDHLFIQWPAFHPTFSLSENLRGKD